MIGNFENYEPWRYDLEERTRAVGIHYNALKSIGTQQMSIVYGGGSNKCWNWCG